MTTDPYQDTSGNPTLQDLAIAIQRGSQAVEPTAEDFEVDDDEEEKTSSAVAGIGDVIKCQRCGRQTRSISRGCSVCGLTSPNTTKETERPADEPTVEEVR